MSEQPVRPGRCTYQSDCDCDQITPDDIPTPAAVVATPTVLPLTQEEITQLRLDHSDTQPKCRDCRWLVTLDAAVARSDAAQVLGERMRSVAQRMDDQQFAAEQALGAVRAALADERARRERLAAENDVLRLKESLNIGQRILESPLGSDGEYRIHHQRVEDVREKLRAAETRLQALAAPASPAAKP